MISISTFGFKRDSKHTRKEGREGEMGVRRKRER
jgi:hypothetical protein